jgi:hypothetical protein
MTQPSPLPVVESQPPQPPNVPDGLAVSVTLVPLGKVAEHAPTELAQLSPDGLLATVPVPVPWNVSVMLGVEPPPPPPPELKHVTLPVMKPVTNAPFDEIPPELVLVVIVAEIRVPPQESP